MAVPVILALLFISTIVFTAYCTVKVTRRNITGDEAVRDSELSSGGKKDLTITNCSYTNPMMHADMEDNDEVTPEGNGVDRS